MPAATPSRRLLALCAALSVSLALPAAAHAADVKTIATGLDNPRGLAFGYGGDLYVAESGRGGTGPCATGVGDSDAPSCYGASGAVTRINVGTLKSRRVATGLPSVAVAGGTDASGPSDIAFPRFGNGFDGFLTVGLGADPATRAQYGSAGAGLAQLYRFRADGTTKPLADLGAFEAANNPDAGQPSAEVDTNPNSVAAVDDHSVVVADAGGNDVLKVSLDKPTEVSTLGVLPFGTAPAPDLPGFPVPVGTPLPLQPVPTSVLRGPQGRVYVGELTGFPFVPGAAAVYLLRPGQAPQAVVTGLTLVTDLAKDNEGNLYVVELSTATLLGPPAPGAVIRIAPDGTRTELAPGMLQAPYGIAIKGHRAYVTTGATTAGGGSVVRINLPQG